MNWLRQIFVSIRSRGFFGTLKWGYEGYFKVNNFILFCRDSTIPCKALSLRPEIEIQELSGSEIKELREKHQNLPFEFYCDETQGFRCCYVAFINSQPAAIHWLVRPGERSRFLQLRDGDVELNYNVVLPQFRGKRLAEYLMAYIVTEAFKNNVKRIFGVVHVSNIPQYKPMLRLGFAPVECLTHFFIWRPKARLLYVK